MLLVLGLSNTLLLVVVALAASTLGLACLLVAAWRLRSWAGERSALEEVLYIAAPRILPAMIIFASGVFLLVLGLLAWVLAETRVLGPDYKAILFALGGLANLVGGALTLSWALNIGTTTEGAAFERVYEKWQRQYR